MADFRLSPTPRPPPPPDEPREERLTIAALLRRITPHAWVTPALGVLLIGCFAASVLAGADLMNPSSEVLVGLGASYGPKFLEGQWWRLLTPSLLHGGLIHLAFNLWAFWNAGQFAERIFGNLAFTVIYLLSAVGATLLSVGIHPVTVSIGASGAIFGVYGALLGFALVHRGVFPPELLRQQRNSLIAFVLYNVVFGFTVKNIDLAGHAGGFVTGLALGALLSRNLLKPSEARARRVLSAVAVAALLAGGCVALRWRLEHAAGVAALGHAERAEALVASGKFEQAAAEWTRAIDASPEARLFYNRAVTWLELGKAGEALADFDRAQALTPAPLNLLGRCNAAVRLASAQDAATVERAAAACHQASAAASGDPDPVERLVRLWLLLGQREKALAELASLDVQKPALRLVKVMLLADAGALDEAEQECAGLLAVPPVSHDALGFCARIARLRGALDVAQHRLDLALAAAPGEPLLVAERAFLHQDRGDFKAAAAGFEEQLRLRPGDPSALNNLAWEQVLSGDFARARVTVEQSLALRPDAPSSLGTRCFALYGLGQLEAAHKDCARALELEPGDATNAGMLQLLDGDRAAAAQTWADAAAKDKSLAVQLAPWIAKLAEAR